MNYIFKYNVKLYDVIKYNVFNICNNYKLIIHYVFKHDIHNINYVFKYVLYDVLKYNLYIMYLNIISYNLR